MSISISKAALLGVFDGVRRSLSTGARPESAERPPRAAVGLEGRRAAHCPGTTSIPARLEQGPPTLEGPARPQHCGTGDPRLGTSTVWERPPDPPARRPTRGPAARARPQAPPPPRPSPPHAQPLLQLPQALRPHGARVEPAARPHHLPRSRAEAERELPRLRLRLRRGFNPGRVWGGSAAAMATGPPLPRPAPSQPRPVPEWQGRQPIREQRAETGRGQGGGCDGERPSMQAEQGKSVLSMGLGWASLRLQRPVG